MNQTLPKRKLIGRLSKNLPRFTNIANYPFTGGEIILTFENTAPDKHFRVLVKKIEPLEGGRVTLSCIHMDSVRVGSSSGDTFTIVVSKMDPFFGYVYASGTEGALGVDEQLAMTDIDIIQIGIISFLKFKEYDGYSSHVGNIMNYLQEEGLLPNGNYYNTLEVSPDKRKLENYQDAMRLLRKVVAARTDGVLRMEASKISYSPNLARKLRDGALITQLNSSEIRYIDREKFLQGIILLAESGVIGGEIRWK